MGNSENKIWRCPVCETINNGDSCVVCGEKYSSYESGSFADRASISSSDPIIHRVEENGHTDAGPDPAPVYTDPRVAVRADGYREPPGGYRMKSIEELSGKREEESSDFSRKLSAIARSYKMRSLDDLED